LTDRAFELFSVCAIEADHDQLNIGHLAELVDDVRKGGTFELAIERGQDQGDRPLAD
jgi:hypothetical protein